MDVSFDLAPRFANGRFRRAALAALAFLVFAAGALYVSLGFLQQFLPQYLPRDWANVHEFDAIIDWKGARLFFQGISPYEAEGLAYLRVAGTGHPPTTPFLFLPLAPFEKALAGELIGLSVWLCLLIHAYLCAKATRFPWPVTLSVLVFSFMIATGGFLMHFWAVQLSEHIAFLYVLCWWYLRRGQEARAGLALGLAASLKLFPGVVMLFLLLARRFRAFAASCITFGAIALIMTARWGIDSWFLFFKQQGPIAEAWFGNVRNASLQGVILRFLFPACEGHAVPDSTATLVSLGVTLPLLAAAVYLSWRPLKEARREDASAIDLPFSLFALLSVFLNAWVWEHYTALMIQPAFVIAAFAVARFRVRLRQWLDEQVTHRSFATTCAFALAMLGGVLLAAKLIATNIYAKERLLELFRATQKPFYHYWFHVYEAVNWLPWVILIALAYACLVARRFAAPARG